jgi:hypothetical protein
MRYVYVPGLIADEGHAPVAYEPAIFGETRFAIRSDGQIVAIDGNELSSATGKAP